MLLEFARCLFTIFGGVGLIALALFLVLLFATVGQGFWQGIRDANNPKRESIGFQFIMQRLHALTLCFYTSFVCIVVAKVLQYFVRDSLE